MSRADRQEDATNRVRAVFATTDSVLIDLDVLQPADLYLDLAGENVRQRLFLVDSDTDRMLCLRPDLTVPASQYYLTHYALGTPVNLRYEGKAFRQVPDGAGRHAEFVQIGMEQYAPADPEQAILDALGLVQKSLDSVGVASVEYRFSDGGLLRDILSHFPLTERERERVRDGQRLDGAPGQTPAPALSGVLAGLSPDEGAALLGEMLAIMGIEPVGERTLSDIAARVSAQAAETSSADIRQAAQRAVDTVASLDAALAEGPARVAALLSGHGVDLDAWAAGWAQRVEKLSAQGIDPSRARFAVPLSRQFQYYDGPVFEVGCPQLGPRRSLAGGGRFDRLLRRLSPSRQDAAVGCAVRPARLAQAAELPS